MDDRKVMEAIEKFHEDCSILVDGISHVVSNHRHGLPKHPRRKGIKQFTYFYAMDLYELFEFARGRGQMSPSYVTQKCEQLLALLFTPVSRQPVDPDWSVFGQTPLGLCILACGARISLRREEGQITYGEVAVLSGWETKHFQRSRLTPLETEDGEDAVMAFDVEAVRAAFKDHGLDI